MTNSDFGPGRDAGLPDAETPDLGDDDAGPADMGVPDRPTTCSERCDPVAGTNCPEEGTTCVLIEDIPRCTRGPGMLERGAPCGATHDCLPGLACFLDEGGEGVCGQICCGVDPEDPACTPAEECGGSGRLVDGTLTRFERCRAPTTGCDLLDPEGCGLGEACYLDGDGTRCFRVGSATEGAPCAVPNECAPQLSCTGFFAPVCTRVCDLAAEVPCPGDEVCTRFAQTPPGTGLCVPGGV